MTKRYFVDAPPTKASVADGTETGPGYAVSADSSAEALRVVRAFRKGQIWSQDMVEVLHGKH